MENIYKQKLTGLLEAVDLLINSKINAFHVSNHKDLFDRFSSILEKLKEINPDYYTDIPKRNYIFQHISGTTFITLSGLLLLKSDIVYCLELMKSDASIEISDFKITKEGIYFSGQYFDAIQKVKAILSDAKSSIVIIDGYINEEIIDLLSSKGKSVEVKILTKEVKDSLRTYAKKFNQQYSNLSIRSSNSFHDRFIIIDNKEYFHFGASIKDAGHKGFMFSRIEEPDVIESLINRFSAEWDKAKKEV